MPLYDCGAKDCSECETAFGPDRSKAIATYEKRESYYAAIEKARKNHSAPPCRVCLSVEKVCVYPLDEPFLAVCPDCCETALHSDGECGHVFEYERSERGRVCAKCGIREYAEDDGGISDRERI